MPTKEKNINQSKKKTTKSLITHSEDFIDNVVWIFKSWRLVWDAFTKNILTLVMIWLVPTVLFLSAFVSLFIGIVSSAGLSTNQTLEVSSLSSLGIVFVISSFILFVVSVIVSLILSPAHYIVQLKSVEGDKISFKQAWSKSVYYIIRVVLLSLLIGALVVLPVLLSILLIPLIVGIFLIIPAVLISWAIIFFTILSPYILIDKDIKVIAAIKESVALTKTKWQWVLAAVAVLFTIQLALLLLSNILPVIGSLIAFVVSIVSTFVVAFVYRKKLV